MTNRIHESAYVDPEVKMGDNNYIGPFCTIYGNVTLGNNNRFEGHATIGSPAEKHGFMNGEQTTSTVVIIGDNNIVREFVTINAGTRRPTIMGNNCVMLRGSHLSHDSILEDNVNVSCSVLIGGESHIMKGANLGLGAILHQFSVVGSYVMIGMGSVCTKKLQLAPGGIWVGTPAKYLKENTVGLERNNVNQEEYEAETKRWLTIKEENAK